MTTYDLNKTERAIFHLLDEEKRWMDFDAIFQSLNPNIKCFSYAAVYKNIRSLTQKELVASCKFHPYKQHFFCIKSILVND